MSYNWNILKIKNIVPFCVNFTEVLLLLNIPRRGNNSLTLRKLLDDNNIDYSHFTGRAREYKKRNETPINDYLNNKTNISSAKLKNKLIKSGLKENKCECCGIYKWNNKPIILQLHHLDGNSKNNCLENLQILCPNCHSLTANYCRTFNTNKQKFYCPDCGKEINKKSLYCPVCSSLHHRKVKRPTKEELYKLLNELKNFTSVGKFYNVSSQTIVKWCTSYNIPKHIKDYK